MKSTSFLDHGTTSRAFFPSCRDVVNVVIAWPPAVPEYHIESFVFRIPIRPYERIRLPFPDKISASVACHLHNTSGGCAGLPLGWCGQDEVDASVLIFLPHGLVDCWWDLLGNVDFRSLR